jgi:hypothetical protein
MADIYRQLRWLVFTEMPRSRGYNIQSLRPCIHCLLVILSERVVDATRSR